MCNQVINEVKNNLNIINAAIGNLERRFPSRKFTLDGHLIGSIGEVIAELVYGIKLCKPSNKGFDGTCDGKEVQIKITQGTSIDIKYEPEVLIVLFYDKKQNEFYEVYNGSGNDAWNLRGNKHQNGEYSISINKLSEINKKARNKLNKSIDILDFRSFLIQRN